MPSKRDPDTLTTGEVAKLLRCSQQMAIRLCDNGLLPSWKHAGSKQRWVLRATVVAYAKAHGIPLLGQPEATDAPAI